MAVVYSVLSEDKGEAQAALQRMCDAFGLETAGPVLMLSGKWLGRARARCAGASVPVRSDLSAGDVAGL